MIKTVVASALPVDEVLHIKKHRMEPISMSGENKRLCIVTGIHGDELEGQYVCYEMIKRINAHKENLKGIVDVYPALNPLGLDTITRGIPKFDLDMNRIFPGNENGSMVEYIASKIIDDITGADLCIDIHSSNIYLKEIPQVRISEESAPQLIPLALKLNVDFIWVHSSITVLESTLAHTLNMLKVPTLALEMGVGMRITRDYCEQVVNGIFHLMKDQGIWEGETTEVRAPIISTDGKVHFINAEASGIFVPAIQHWKEIKIGQHMGDIIDPLTGCVIQSIDSPCDGAVFTLREYPVVYEGSLIARILGGDCI